MKIRSRYEEKEKRPRKPPPRFTGEFKPHVFPDGFCLIVDTREQMPLFTKIPKGLMIKKDTLHNGDYSIKGFEDKFAVERKGISDFLGYVGAERDKTIRKLKELTGYEFRALVIECDEDELYFGSMYSQIGAETIRASLVSFQVRYGLHVYISDDRKKIERVLLDWAIKFFNIKKEVGK
jgi:ERCC4-type nuclease